MLSQFVHCPGPEHVAAAVRVLRYLKRSPGQGLFFPMSGDLELVHTVTQIGRDARRPDARPPAIYTTRGRPCRGEQRRRLSRDLQLKQSIEPWRVLSAKFFG
ncbi:unnamed protein product [Linum tenue]|uniref:Uncharacterized protein n=1 Tax=Linum tenue TaxID=586396 RepID=A0AAV0GP11_9ROSI|nr:unnamed protein product [Linum tenue]